MAASAFLFALLALGLLVAKACGAFQGKGAVWWGRLPDRAQVE